ncbi:MAG: type III-B CRISPR module RAMP protein Cmr6 [Methylothermaceae bacterium]|nr:type III-B CRISPR module RAMP protein Cmr6 [Methylothermaceae bacterium]
MIPAVPRYLEGCLLENFNKAPPGHRFTLYFRAWNKKDWKLEKNRKGDALKQTLSIPPESGRQIEALRHRQSLLVAAIENEARLSVEAVSTAPLATGMGMEHPLENGFAFLNPYGLPYLPGSSIKGVLRRAAEELRDTGEVWSQSAIDILFGPEPKYDEDARRGALTFWDAIPEVKSMDMDVMTPHYGDYYQGQSTPHDAGQPNPIVFMVVPAGARFCFHVTVDSGLLNGLEDWKPLMESAFQHAFDWLGFGAKTAVGYGAMRRDEEAEKAAERELEENRRRAEEEARRGELTPLERELEEIRDREKNDNFGLVLLHLLDEGHWERAKDRRMVAAKIKALWQAEKKWNPDFSGTNRSRLKQKARCEKVVAYLQSED